jgi:nitrate reductase NapAB chaperone NapD
MAIMGFLVHTLDEAVQEVETAIQAMPEMTTYGVHQEHFIVTVVEAPSNKIEKTVDKITKLEGVLTTYTTYLTIEDEIDEDGNLQTDFNVTDFMRKNKKTE